jgi:hypothetical protein
MAVDGPCDGQRKAMRAPSRNKGTSSRGPKWSSKEDECLAGAWKVVSMDLLTCVKRNSDTHWARVKVPLNECKPVDSDFNTMHMDNNESSMSHRWDIIQQVCNRCHGIRTQVSNQADSGTSIADQVRHIWLISSPLCIVNLRILCPFSCS